MVDRERTEKRLMKLEQAVRKLGDIGQVSLEVFLQDDSRQAMAERYFQIAAQICIDIAGQLVSERGYRLPYGYGDIFSVLREEGVISKDMAETMKQIAGFRNILVHDYMDIDPSLVYNSLSKVNDFVRFAENVVQWF